MVTPLGLAASPFGSNNPVQPLLMDRSMEAIASSSPILAKLPNCRVMVDLVSFFFDSRRYSVHSLHALRKSGVSSSSGSAISSGGGGQTSGLVRDSRYHFGTGPQS